MTWLSCFGGGRRTVAVEIFFPDSSKLIVDYSRTARTRQLISASIDHLRLKREGDYFGLSYKSKNGSIDNYLDPNKSLMEQLPKSQQNQNAPRLKFRVRFYPPDPQRLKEEAARHWLYLQMRADMLAGLLDASDEASAELAAYAAQAELGDMDSTISEADYSQIKLLPRVMPPTWTDDVAANHKQLTGLSRQESEQRFLWRVRKLARYGEQRFRLQAAVANAKDGEAVISARGLEMHQNGESQHVRWRYITQLDFRDKTFEIRTQSGMILSVRVIDKATCKALFQQASGHHQLFRHFKEKDHDRDDSKYSIKYFDGKSLNGGVRSSKREGMFTDKSDGESQIGKGANGSVSRFPPAKSRDRRRSREGGRGAKTSGDESDDNGRARRARRREERMRAVMTDTEAVVRGGKGSQQHSRMAGNSTERLVQPQFPSNGIQAKVRSKQKDIEARNELWKHINEHVQAAQGEMGDLAYTEVKTVGNPMNVTKRRERRDKQVSSSTGRIGGHHTGHTPRRRRRDRVERAVAQTDWEGQDQQMVGPLPVTSSVLRDDRGTMSDWDTRLYPNCNSANNPHRKPLGESNHGPSKSQQLRHSRQQLQAAQAAAANSRDNLKKSSSRNINFNNATNQFSLYGTQV